MLEDVASQNVTHQSEHEVLKPGSLPQLHLPAFHLRRSLEPRSLDCAVSCMLP